MWGRHILAGSHWRLLPQGCSNHPRSQQPWLPASHNPSCQGAHRPGPTPQEPKVLLYITPGDVSIFIAVLKIHILHRTTLSNPCPFLTPTKGFQTLVVSWGSGIGSWIVLAAVTIPTSSYCGEYTVFYLYFLFCSFNHLRKIYQTIT